VTIETIPSVLESVAIEEHRDCIVCGRGNADGLRLQFTEAVDGSVKTVFSCEKKYRGYSGVLHGGIVSCLLDGAMTNCLFSKGVVALTGEMTIRYLRPVTIDIVAVVRAHVTRSRSPLYLLEAELSQDGIVKASAAAKFMEI